MRSLAAALIVACVPVGAAAQNLVAQSSRGYACEDTRTTGWNFYCEDLAVEDEVPESEDPLPTAPAPPTPPAPPPAPLTYTEQIEAYRAALDELKYRAVLEPTQENVIAYMQAQAEMVQQAGLFTEVWQRALFANPALDANVNRPLSQIGSNLYQDSLDLEREAALANATSEHALMFVYEGGAECLVCSVQGEVMTAMKQTYGISVLPVTRDGIALPAFPDSQLDQGQLANLGLEDIPSPFLALVEPRSGFVELIGAGLMTQDVVIDRIRIITSIPEGELYD